MNAVHNKVDVSGFYQFLCSQCDSAITRCSLLQAFWERVLA